MVVKTEFCSFSEIKVRAVVLPSAWWLNFGPAASFQRALAAMAQRLTSPSPLLALPPRAPPCQVYPGKGRIFVTRAGVKVVLAGSKTASLYKQRKKSAKLQWTLPWRRMHKKVNSEAGGKRKVRKVVKVTVNRSMEGRDSATVSVARGRRKRARATEERAAHMACQFHRPRPSPLSDPPPLPSTLTPHRLPL